MATTLDDHIDKPSVTEPGDGPADTTDPTEAASSVSPDKGAAAQAGYGTVNAVVPLKPRRRPERDKGKDRTETYEVEGPDGEPVKVTRNIETGEVTRGGGSTSSSSSSSGSATSKTTGK